MSLKEAPIVEVLTFDEKEAYNHDRHISSLIRTQLLHLHHAEYIVVPPKARTKTNINDLLTEKAASEYIQKVTRLLHRYGNASGQTKPKKKAAKPAKKAGKKSKSGKKARKRRERAQ